MSRTTLGVLGGMGPAATAHFLSELVAHTDARCDQEHLDVIVLNHATLPDRTQALLQGGTACAELAHLLQYDIQTLAACGAQTIALPCNTAHAWLSRLVLPEGVAVIDMVDETVRRLARLPDVRTVGVLATRGTVRSGLYETACMRHGLRAAIPGVDRQTDIERIIYQVVKGGSPPEDESVHLFDRTVESLFEQGCDAVAIACTELSAFTKRAGWRPDAQRGSVVDALDVLVHAAIVQAGGRYRLASHPPDDHLPGAEQRMASVLSIPG